MARATRIDTQRLDLSGFEAWLRAQLPGPALAAVLAVVLQVIRALFEQNTQLRARVLGRHPKPPSERLSAVDKQLAFAFTLPANDVLAPPAVAPAPQPADDAQGEKPAHRPRRTRKPLPKHIAVIESVNAPADTQCPGCKVPMSVAHRRFVDVIELVPAQIIIRRRVDETFACKICDAMRAPASPPALFDGGLLGPVLVGEALASKVLDGMPIERQSRNYRRQGVDIAPSTLGRAVSALLAQLVPLAGRIAVRVKRSDRVQMDSTGLRVLDPKAVAGTHRDTLWVMIGDARWVWYAALRDGDGDAIERLMRGADADTFQCDGTGVTNFVEKKWRRCRPGCHAHARRKFVEAARRGDLRAMEAVRLYARLFAIEREATRAGLTAEARQQLRWAQTRPVLEQLRAWVTQIAPSVEPKSPLGEGVTYLQRQWLRLSVLLLDGEVEATNNRCERALRPWTLGQHTWLFVGDQVHAERWAAAYSLLYSALAHGLNPRAYLHAVAARLIAGHPHTRLDELLPDAMLAAHPELADPLRAGADGGGAVARDAA